MQNSIIDFEKFAKFSKPGPRYTSYPTAVEFSKDFSYETYLELLAKDTRNLSLYTHLPFCRSACYFCGCNVIYTSKEDNKTTYIAYLKKELQLLKNSLACNREVKQFHFGGGTPTFFNAQQLEEIISSIKEVFSNFSADGEFSCEIDPRFFTQEQMQVLKKHHFNRLSFGVQDFDSKVQEAIHRIQSFELVKNAILLAREYGICSINFDLIYGLPYQNTESFRNTLEKVLSLNPDRLAIFNYAHVPWIKKTMRKIDESTLPSPKEKLRIFQGAIEFLESHGYKMIGMDHFAKENDELFLAIEKNELRRNFQGYSTKGGTQSIGIGLTSIGEGEDYYAQNYKELKDYQNAIDSGKLPLERGIVLSLDDKIRKSVIMQLMSNFKLDFRGVEKEFHINFNDYFAKELQEMQNFAKEDLLTLHKDGLQVSKTGMLLIRNIAQSFDAYMQKHTQNKIFSKTI